jgi:hypothetical protein
MPHATCHMPRTARCGPAVPHTLVPTRSLIPCAHVMEAPWRGIGASRQRDTLSVDAAQPSELPANPVSAPAANAGLPGEAGRGCASPDKAKESPWLAAFRFLAGVAGLAAGAGWGGSAMGDVRVPWGTRTDAPDSPAASPSSATMAAAVARTNAPKASTPRFFHSPSSSGGAGCRLTRDPTMAWS